jgi:hypothetical protein
MGEHTNDEIKNRSAILPVCCSSVWIGFTDNRSDKKFMHRNKIGSIPII